MSSAAPSVPLIGVPCGLRYATGSRALPLHAVGESYLRALTEAGAMPLIIPLVEDSTRLRAAYERLDGLLLAGGGDVDPAMYGEAPHPATRNIDRRRDEVEATLARWALASGLPILAICRGIQVLNVAAGGTLYQDVSDELPGALKHDYYPDYPRTLTPHHVEVTRGSRLAAILSDADPPVNSLHHQGVRVPAPGLVVVARAPDGLIEGLEHPSHAFAVGVQWHPEERIDQDPPMRRLFGSYVEACSRSLVS